MHHVIFANHAYSGMCFRAMALEVLLDSRLILGKVDRYSGREVLFDFDAYDGPKLIACVDHRISGCAT